MTHRIQIASADNTDREDERLNSEHWEGVASGETYEELIEELLRSANSEEFDISNSWLRLVRDDKEVVTF